MPIRFRCVYCDQLLGIAKRKAGSVVKCPNCAGQLIVPSPGPSADDSDQDLTTAAADDVILQPLRDEPDKTEHAPAPANNEGPGMLFERSDFDELLKPAIERREPALAGQAQRPSRKQSSAPAPAPVPAPHSTAPSPPAPAFDFSAAPAPGPAVRAAARTMPPTTTRSGILLTPIKLIVLSVLVMAGMAFAFGGGVLLGWYLHK